MRLLIMFLIVSIVISCKKEESKIDQLGVIELKVTGNNVAQPHFVKGLLLLHSFEYDDAREEFLTAQELDSKMAMAYWGEAMTHNHTIWHEQEYEEGFSALEKFKVNSDIEELTEVEIDFLKAVDILYSPKTGKEKRDEAYMRYMEKLHMKYPQNHEVASFYALALLGSVTEGRNDSIYGLGAQVAEKILKENPNHPGALHYLIHSYDDPVHAKLALSAANSYSKVAPDASHALHMPSHIYVALGMWDEVINSNIDSYQASINRMDRKKLDNNARGYHAYHWLEYGYLQNGMIDEAAKMVLEMEQLTNETPSKRSRVHMIYLKGTYLVETNAWESSIADIEIDHQDLNLTVRTQYGFLEGYKAFIKKDPIALNEIIENATQEIAKESLLVSNLDDGFTVCSSALRDTPTQTNINESLTMLSQLKALSAWLKDDKTDTERWLIESKESELSLSYSFGPPVIQKPTHELYADWLIAQKRYEEALEEYDLTLKVATNRKLAREGRQIALSFIEQKVASN